MTEADRAYFAEREEKERAMAEHARDPAIALAHRRLAEAYARRLREAQAPV